MLTTAYNASGAAVTIDCEGRQLHAGDWGVIDTLADQVRPALDDKSLIQVDIDPKDANPAAAQVAADLERITARAEQVQELDKGDLAELLGRDDGYSKAELVWLVAVGDIELPAADEAAKPDESADVAPEPSPDTPDKPAAKKTAAARRSSGEGN